MDHQKPKSVNAPQSTSSTKPLALVFPVRGGTGTARLAPPWSRSQVQWLGKGYYILRLATEETSRWLLGACFSWNDVFPHEKTFRRAAVDKSAIMTNLEMNPWPAHLTSDSDPESWRNSLAQFVQGKQAVLDTGHVTLWKMQTLPKDLQLRAPFVVLDGHHSRKAQRYLGLPQVFGWLEPMQAPQLSVRAIHRAGSLARFLEASVQSGELKVLAHAPNPEDWHMNSSHAFEVIQVHKRWWCEVSKPNPNESALDALARIAKGKAFLKTTPHYEDLVSWLERLEIDTGLRLPPPTKEYVRERALKRQLFTQKATHFYPKIPFGLLVQDLR